MILIFNKQDPCQRSVSYRRAENREPRTKNREPRTENRRTGEPENLRTGEPGALWANKEHLTTENT
jgi:hypothetical protein